MRLYRNNSWKKGICNPRLLGMRQIQNISSDSIVFIRCRDAYLRLPVCLIASLKM